MPGAQKNYKEPAQGVRPGQRRHVALRVSQAPSQLARSTGRRLRFVLRRILLLGDMLAVLAAMGFCVVLVPGEDAGATRLAWGTTTLPFWALLFKLYGLYDRDDKRVGHSTVDDVPPVFHAAALGALATWFAFRVLPAEQLVLAEGLALFGSVFLGVLATRAAVRAVAYRSTAGERVLVLGAGPVAEVLVRKIRAHPEYRLTPVGYLDQVDNGAPQEIDGLPRLGEIDEIASVCESHAIDYVIVISSHFEHDVLTDFVRRTRALPVRIAIVPDLVDVLGPSVEIGDIEGLTVLGLNPPVLTRSSRLLKRGMDIALAGLALLAAAPLIALAAIAIRLTSRGPVVYSQERVGLGGRRFMLHKLRTMVHDAEARLAEVEKRSAHPAWLLVEDDPRITLVGRFLRLTSIDELPQLWNVIRGDMSLVGPRPMTPRVHEHISGWERRRLDLTPGITGLWQVLGRTTIPFEEMLKLDYLYVTNWSLWQDVRLLIRTLPVVVRRRGAN